MALILEQFAVNRRIGRFLFFSIVVLSSLMYLWGLNGLPLTDYDEATYAQVTRHTLESDDNLTLRRFGEPWFEKPPLYFWLAGAATAMLGTADKVYRLPSALLAILGVALIWLLVNKLSKNNLTATLASLVLLFYAFYYFNAREVRLDIPVITSVLAVITALVHGWSKPKYLIFIGPALAIGVLFKSVVALFAVPIVLIFSLIYKRFSWLVNLYLWLGGLIGLAIIIPWHWYQLSQWGENFWQGYLRHHILDRYVVGIDDYSRFFFWPHLKTMWFSAQPWTLAAIIAMLATAALLITKKIKPHQPLIYSSFISAVVLFTIISFSRTAIFTYLLPVIPFMVIFIASSAATIFMAVRSIFSRSLLILLIVISFGYSIALLSGKIDANIILNHFEYDKEQKEIGLIVAENPPANFYLLDWPRHESLRFYSNHELTVIDFPPEPGSILTGPWYLMVTNLQIPFFLNDNGSPKEKYSSIELKYNSGKIFLFYGEKELIF
jgi:4-amino-4-deoxy-L-arabinose transferase-like glycosyltransferase